MGQAQNIIFKNTFSQKNNLGYGSSPGSYLSGYVARDDATENWNPHSEFDFQDDQAFLKQTDGRIFGSEGLAYKSQQVDALKDEINQEYQRGKTIQRIVVSFPADGTYLNKLGVLSDSREHQKRGDYRNRIDELKLRTAISDGMRQMTDHAGYRQPYWAGSIQVNTDNVHAHIVLYDQDDQNDRKRPDGQERGIFRQYEMEHFRDGLEHSAQWRQKLVADSTMLKANQRLLTQKVAEDVAQDALDHLVHEHRLELPKVQQAMMMKSRRQIDEQTPSNVQLQQSQLQQMQQEQMAIQVEKRRKLELYRKRYLKELQQTDKLAKQFANESNSIVQTYYQTELKYHMQNVDRYRQYFGNPKSVYQHPQNAFEEWWNGNRTRDTVFLRDNESNTSVNYLQDHHVDSYRDLVDGYTIKDEDWELTRKVQIKRKEAAQLAYQIGDQVAQASVVATLQDATDAMKQLQASTYDDETDDHNDLYKNRTNQFDNEY